MAIQAFSYPVIGKNNLIYIPPYGFDTAIDYMIVFDPKTLKISQIKLDVDESREKWIAGIPHNNKIYFLPYGESKILILDIETNKVDYVEVPFKERGKYVQGHIYENKIIALPYGEWDFFDYILIFDLDTHTCDFKKIDLPKNDEKKWHTTQLVGDIIYGVPRGENWHSGNYFPYRIEYNCKTNEYKLFDLSFLWNDYDKEEYTNKKYTTLAKVGTKLYAPPYSQNPNFDIMLRFDGTNWTSERTGLKETSRKYYTHIVAKNGKIFFPPAGHEEDWAEMLVVDSKDDSWHTLKLNIGKESKKYFAGAENSKGKLYFIPRGGCVCMPEESWKQCGDLTEVLVIDSNTEEFYTIDINQFFTENTTIEKYNKCVILNDIIYAFPYGESHAFQTVLIFDTISEKVIGTVDLNVVQSL
jgi:hypothetical protein